MSLLFFMSILICDIFCYNIDLNNVIVYQYPTSGGQNVYFGMSVAIRPKAEEKAAKDWVLQIGAPRGNMPGVGLVEPGAVYRCHATGPCNLFYVDRVGNEIGIAKDGTKFFVAKKDGGWIGIAMDTAINNNQEISVICGHRISSQSSVFPTSGPYYIGGCYVDYMNGLDATFFMPLKNQSRFFFMNNTTPYGYDWANGMAGWSAALTKKGLLLGAPFVFHTTGTVLKYSLNGAGPFVAIMPHKKDKYYAYHGYSVASGYLFDSKTLWYVMGSPKANSYHGGIFVGKYVSLWDGREEFVRNDDYAKGGEKFGEYFGASLDVGKLNGDPYDDLVVGAPMYSDTLVDQGRIYIFYGGEHGFLRSSFPITGKVEYGRFGMSVKVAGDLDQDGYNDLVVAAPYEDGGVLYIFQGYERGVRPKPSQVIHASTISSSLKGFGVSISRAFDLDGNKFPDFLVGAYKSDQAVLLRSRPVVTLKPFIKHPKLLERNQTDFSIAVCFYFLAAHPPNSIVVDATITVDRGLFAIGNTTTRKWSFRNVQVIFSSPTCANLTVVLNVNGSFNTPVEIKLKTALTNSSATGKNQFVWANTVQHLPLEGITSFYGFSKSYDTKIAFASDCGLDNICDSHLMLRCSFDDYVNSISDFVVGSNDVIKLDVTVQNVREPAYDSVVVLDIVNFPKEDMDPLPSSCSWITNVSMSCAIGTVTSDADVSLTFQINTKNWASLTTPTLHFEIVVATDSNDALDEDSAWSFELELKSRFDIELIASPSEATISLDSNPPPHIDFSHNYEVARVLGPTPVAIVMDVLIPMEIDGVVVASVVLDEPGVARETLNYDLEGNLGHRSLDLPDTSSQSFPAERTLFLDCSVSDVKCTRFSFNFPAPTPIAMHRDISIVLNITALKSIRENLEVIHFTTNGTAKTIKDNKISRRTTSTSVIMALPPAAVDVRIIVLSAIAGGLFLALLIPVLIREGFFRRKTKEQMQNLKDTDFINERFSFSMLNGEPDRSSRISVATVEG